ncbi:recombinase family protein [Clostridium sp. FP1]|uniref:recombinase family protein n=1 Tax=Clostridium sp. FP1 TaxID=2724076 RepID=UPI0013E99704|nr:recombinase family protein [Clostridium sp. FP1]MBZ9635602.1 recombinase family protein [Clostridium sp. FP1]
MIYGYARISTWKQIQGNSLEDQVSMLNKNGCTKIIQEQFTGKTTDRPLFNKLVDKLNDNDSLMVCKLDRLARSTTEGLQIVQTLVDKGVKLVILNMGTFDNTPSGRLSLTMFLAFAQFERDMIIERTQAGKEVAKTKAGFKDGRPKLYTDVQLNMALDLLKENSYKQVATMTKISEATLVRAMRKRKAEAIQTEV